MQINGLDTIKIKSAVLEFIGLYFDNEDTINVESINNYIIDINNSLFIFITPREVKRITEEENNDCFNNAIISCSKKWRNYIDKDSWIEDNGYSRERALCMKFTGGDGVVEFIQRCEDYNVYKLRR